MEPLFSADGAAAAVLSLAALHAREGAASPSAAAAARAARGARPSTLAAALGRRLGRSGGDGDGAWARVARSPVSRAELARLCGGSSLVAAAAPAPSPTQPAVSEDPTSASMPSQPCPRDQVQRRDGDSGVRALVVVLAGYALSLVEFTDVFEVVAEAEPGQRPLLRALVAPPSAPAHACITMAGSGAVSLLLVASSGDSECPILPASFVRLVSCEVRQAGGTLAASWTLPSSAPPSPFRTREAEKGDASDEIVCEGDVGDDSDGGDAEPGVDAAVMLTLGGGGPRSSPRRALVFAVTRRYLAPCANDGHTLCLCLPLAPPRSSEQAQPSQLVRVRSLFLDPSLAGVANVVCPSHEITVRLSHSPCAAALGAGLRTVQPVSLVADIEADCSAGAASDPSLGRPLVLLLEPRNLAADWAGLAPAPVGAGKGKGGASALAAASAPASGLLALLHWAAAVAAAHGEPQPAYPPFALAPLPIATSCAADAVLTPPPAPAARLDGASLPRHIAVVMDGNGRWAKARGLPRSAGHRAGVEAIHALIRACRRLRVPFLTLYAFSSQNWARPADEVRALMQLLAEFVATDLEELCDNGVRLLVNGDLARLPLPARSGLARMVAASCGNRGLTLCLALSYGGREEIVGGVAAACRAAKAGLLDPSSLTPESFRSAFLPHPDVPDPCLLVRTSGELRVSNFLLWQIAYTELYVTPALWPDFDDAELTRALVAFAARERRFGKTAEQVQAHASVQAQAASPLHAPPQKLGQEAAALLSELGAAAGGAVDGEAESTPEAEARDAHAGPARTGAPQQQQQRSRRAAAKKLRLKQKASAPRGAVAAASGVAASPPALRSAGPCDAGRASPPLMLLLTLVGFGLPALFLMLLSLQRARAALRDSAPLTPTQTLGQAQASATRGDGLCPQPSPRSASKTTPWPWPGPTTTTHARADVD